MGAVGVGAGGRSQLSGNTNLGPRTYRQRDGFWDATGTSSRRRRQPLPHPPHLAAPPANRRWLSVAMTFTYSLGESVFIFRCYVVHLSFFYDTNSYTENELQQNLP